VQWSQTNGELSAGMGAGAGGGDAWAEGCAGDSGLATWTKPNAGVPHRRLKLPSWANGRRDARAETSRLLAEETSTCRLLGITDKDLDALLRTLSALGGDGP